MYYKMNLIEFIDRYGVDTTNNFQLLYWAKQLKLKNFCVLMKDEIKDIDFKPNLNLITNIECSDKSGAHWSAFHKGAKFTAFDKAFNHFWYDSYGRPPDQEIIDKFGQGSIIASDDQNQKFGTRCCGQLALYFLYRINNGDPFDKIISELKNADRYLIRDRERSK